MHLLCDPDVGISRTRGDELVSLPFLQQVGTEHALRTDDQNTHWAYLCCVPSRRQSWGRCKAVGVHPLGYSGGRSYKEVESVQLLRLCIHGRRRAELESPRGGIVQYKSYWSGQTFSNNAASRREKPEPSRSSAP